MRNGVVVKSFLMDVGSGLVKASVFDGCGEVYLERWQAHVLLVDGGLARCGEGSTEFSRGKVEVYGRCVWLQRDDAWSFGIVFPFF